MSRRTDFVVIGGGIAGASLAYELAEHGSVILLEAEGQAGYHATGRSAALFSETYGNATVRALSAASRSFLESPPEDFDGPILSERGAIQIGRPSDADKLREFVRECQIIQPSVELIGSSDILKLVPILRKESAAVGAYEPDAREIETSRMHQGYIRGLRRRGGTIVTSARITQIRSDGATWRLTAGAEEIIVPVVVNAAGAWADEVAVAAGVMPLGLRALRRTAVIVLAPPAIDVRRWPMVFDFDEQFYFKPDADRLLLSPADETLSEPVDAMPDDFDVAVAVDRFEAATTMQVRRVEHSWAGLRTFASDRSPVVGFDHVAHGFFWFAGQGGYGFQIAPSLARLGAALASGAAPPEDLMQLGVTRERLSPARFAV